MSKQEESLQFDSLLTPFLQSEDEYESQRLLAELIGGHADMIRASIGYKLREFIPYTTRSRENHDAEDVYSEVLMKLLKRLRDFKSDPAGKPICNFNNYIKGLTDNTCSEYLRKRFPQRSKLQDRLRYLLTHKPDFALWKGREDGWLCGFSSWRNTHKLFERTSRLQQLREDPRSLALPTIHTDLQLLKTPELLYAIFEWAGSPVEMDDLVYIVAELQGTRDAAIQTVSTDVMDTRPGGDEELGQRLRLKRLWTEICELPLRQRFALLMNLKDDQGRDLTRLLPLTGVCTLQEIAEALNWPLDQLAETLNDLPLDDISIANYMGIKRQQVINLRKSARERLARRIKYLSE